MPKPFSIGSRIIADEQPSFIIAEAGSNHNKDWETAMSLIKVAAEAGADAIKFQTFRASDLYSKSAGKSDYLSDEKSIYEIVTENEMPRDWIPRLAEECHKQGILFLSTPFDEESVELLAPFVPAFKVASYELTHLPLIQHMLTHELPLILSTGAANMEEINETVTLFKSIGKLDFALLQCTARYPAPIETLNLRSIPFLREQFDVYTGLSDHSEHPSLAPAAAVCLGARIIEKHVTLDKKLPGPDHAFSLNPDELRHMIRMIRLTETALGTHDKKPALIEDELRHFARRSLFVIRPVETGDVFTKENIAILRRGKNELGLPPRDLNRILGKKAKHPLSADTLLKQDDIADA